jgi:para-aminobenzoate synthetase component 1
MVYYETQRSAPPAIASLLISQQFSKLNAFSYKKTQKTIPDCTQKSEGAPMDELSGLLGRMGPVDQVIPSRIRLGESFLDVAQRFTRDKGTVVLHSCGTRDCSSRSFLAAAPWLQLKSLGTSVELELDGKTACLEENPLDAVSRILGYYRLTGYGASTPVCGLFGYLAYDLKNQLERLPRTAVNDLGLPEMLLYAPSLLLEHPTGSSEATLWIPRRRNESTDRAEQVRQWFQARLSQAVPELEPFRSTDEPSLESTFSRDGYKGAVSMIREYIRSGHVYQVNLSQRFRLGARGDGFSAFRELFAANPAPFHAYIQAGDHQILSTSPERFLARRGEEVESRPIKGTRPRGETPRQDQHNAEELLASGKDAAELSMIVDLVRNDLGKVCAPGSIEVSRHKQLESYANVHHLVSVVRGRLAPHASSTELIRAAFPGGSITGCPKVRAMEIIDELEPRCRHVYTGSIGYLGFTPCLDLSIAIRTVTLLRDDALYSVGGGVVLDSDPDAEYEETLDKGRTLKERLAPGTSDGGPRERVWIDGGMVPRDKAAIPALSPGFHYGQGVFETVRAHDGVPYFLREHVHRLQRSWRELFPTAAPDPDWREVILQVLRANGLERGSALIKIIAARGERSSPPFDDTLVLRAAPYTHRLERLSQDGLRLALYPEPRRTPLASHKTLNHLLEHLTGEWARQQGADEALLLNPDGSVSETNSANLIALFGQVAVFPESEYVLPGITAEKTLPLLRDRAYQVKRRTLMPAELYRADAVLLTNSLMGVVSAISLDGFPLADGRTTASELCLALFPELREGTEHRHSRSQ